LTNLRKNFPNVSSPYFKLDTSTLATLLVLKLIVRRLIESVKGATISLLSVLKSLIWLLKSKWADDKLKSRHEKVEKRTKIRWLKDWRPYFWRKTFAAAESLTKLNLKSLKRHKKYKLLSFWRIILGKKIKIDEQ
jgi:hypothetical protein